MEVTNGSAVLFNGSCGYSGRYNSVRERCARASRFYGKPIFSDVSPEAVSKAETALKAADIKYTVQTIRSRNALLQAGDVNAYRKINMAYTPERDKMSYVYNIYVRRYLREEALRALGKKA